MASILYVDDTHDKSKRLCSLLEQKGHSVHVVDRAERAMIFLDRAGSCELLLLHLYLHGMDGAELCRWVQARGLLKGAPKVAFTWAGLRLPADASDGPPSWLPVDRFIEEVVRMDELVEVVDRLLAARDQEQTVRRDAPRHASF